MGDLKGTLGFDGWVMSDWLATHSTKALRQGLDQEMPLGVHFAPLVLKVALATGSLAEADVDAALTRMRTPPLPSPAAALARRCPRPPLPAAALGRCARSPRSTPASGHMRRDSPAQRLPPRLVHGTSPCPHPFRGALHRPQ